jgi:hypothetical protein
MSRTASGDAMVDPEVVRVRFHPATEAALEDAEDAPSRRIRRAIREACETQAMRILVPTTPPSEVVTWGELGDARSAKCPHSLVADFDTLVDCGYAQSRSHGIRRAVRDHLEVSVDGDE